MTAADEFATDEMRIFSLLSDVGFKPATVFDIGASNGAWSALISRIFPEANFHLFEPLANVLPDYEHGLLWQIQTHPTFTLHPVALGGADKTVTMRLHADGFSSTTLNLTAHPEYKNTLRVPQYRLDSFVEKHHLPLPEVLKLDTQGAERLILGKATTCLKHASVVFAESWLCRGYGPETPLLFELQDLLNDLDYDLVELGHRFYDASHRLYGCDAFFFRRPFAKQILPLMPNGVW